MTIKKINVETEQEINYGGGFTEKEIKEITKGYTFNGFFYERQNSKYIFYVEG